MAHTTDQPHRATHTAHTNTKSLQRVRVMVSKMLLPLLIMFCAVSQLLSVVECKSTGSASGGLAAFETLVPSFDPLMMVNITAAFENEKAQAIVQSTRKSKRRTVRQFPQQPESIEDSMAMVNGRRLVDACDTSSWKFADDASLSGSDGWNVLSASCNLGSHFTVPSGKTLKIKKDPTMVGELVIDRQATSANKGRHFYVLGILFVERLVFTKGYGNSQGGVAYVNGANAAATFNNCTLKNNIAQRPNIIQA